MLNRKQKGKDMVNKIEIRPADGRKSFGKKAFMVQYDEYWAVISYGREVALVRKTEEGMVELTRIWMGYTQTTMRHIRGAIAMLGAGHYLCKREWKDICYKESVVVE